MQPHLDPACFPGVNQPRATSRERAPIVVDARTVAAIAAVWVFWGSTFAAMRLAVQTMPPFAMASLRFTIAGAILYAICAVRGRARFSRDDLVRGLVTGMTLLLLGNGVTAWTIQYLPTGVNALLLSPVPIWMALIAFVWGGERPTRVAIAGMCAGFGGLALLLWPSHISAPLPPGPTAIALLAGMAWAFGSVYARRTGKVENLLLATSVQMLCGGGLIGIEAALLGQWRDFDVRAISSASLGAFTWLVVFGSLVGYSAYLYTMQIRNATLASTYAYVNPLVAVIIGVAVFHERVSLTEMIAGTIILGGVALMMMPSPVTPPASDAMRRPSPRPS